MITFDIHSHTVQVYFPCQLLKQDLVRKYMFTSWGTRRCTGKQSDH